MTTENKNIIVRCGLYEELLQPNQLQPGQMGVCTDRPELLYRRRENAVVRPSEIDHFVCTTFSQPETDRTGGIVVEQAPNMPVGVMQIYNAWVGQIMASSTDVDATGIPHHGYLHEKIICLDGIVADVVGYENGEVVPSNTNSSPNKVLRIRLDPNVAMTDRLVSVSETDTHPGTLVDKFVCQDGSIEFEIIGDDTPNGYQQVVFRATGGGNNFLKRDGTNTFAVITDETNVSKDEGACHFNGVEQTLKVMSKSTHPLLLNRQNRLLVMNNTDSVIHAGRAVYLSGWYGDFPTISLSIASSQSTAFVSGVVMDTILPRTVGEIMGYGILRIDTTGLAPNSMLWLSATEAGRLTTTPPAFPNYLSLVARVVIVGDSTTGAISIEKGVLPTISSSNGDGAGGVVDATYLGFEAFPVAMITGGSSGMFGSSNGQLWTAVTSRFDTQINRLSAMLLAEYTEPSAYTRFGITDVDGNLLGQTEVLETSLDVSTSTRGIKTLKIENNGVVNINKNRIYFFTLASSKNGASWGVGSGYQSNQISSGEWAKLALESSNSGIASTGSIPVTPNGASSSTQRIWMIGFKE